MSSRRRPRRPDEQPVEKPTYTVPTMAEIRVAPRNGYRVASSFTGCGGSCLGFAMAGYTTVWASEFIDVARACYEANFPGVPVDARDVRMVQPSEILATCGLAPGELDVLEGSPPCASFSTSGKREQGWGQVTKYSETTQRVDDLFWEYARLLEGLQPRVFVAENVRGLTIGRAKGYYLAIKRRLADCGYRVGARLLDAQWLGVPQRRPRVVFVGVRADLGLDPVFPHPFAYRYTVRDALPDVAGFSTHKRSTVSARHRPAPTILTHWRGFSQMRAVDERRRADEAAASIERFAIAREARRLRPGQVSRKYLNLIRASAHEPCPTVTAEGGYLGTAAVVHPSASRKFTIAELKALFSFPSDFELVGTYAQQWERLGRCVPPFMMRAVAQTVRDELLAKLETRV